MGRRYSPESERYIEKYYGILPTEIIAEALARSVTAIQAKHYKIRREEAGPHYRHWTEAEDDALRQLTKEGIPDRYIARRLGREESAVLTRKYLIGIRGRGAYRKWRADDIKRLREMMGRGMSYKSMAAALGRGYNSVKNMAIKIKREDEKNVCDKV